MFCFCAMMELDMGYGILGFSFLFPSMAVSLTEKHHFSLQMPISLKARRILGRVLVLNSH